MIHPEIQELIDEGIIQITLENGFVPTISLTHKGEQLYGPLDEEAIEIFLEKAERDLEFFSRQMSS